jgi:ATPase family protein associated with various cellular activities (AAA)
VKRVAVLASASGSGKTTFARTLAEKLGVAFVELDALNHGPGWSEATPEELRAKVVPIVATDSWVIDGAYRGKLGDLVLQRADTVVRRRCGTSSSAVTHFSCSRFGTTGDASGSIRSNLVASIWFAWEAVSRSSAS